jgi:hypothetical protein
LRHFFDGAVLVFASDRVHYSLFAFQFFIQTTDFQQVIKKSTFFEKKSRKRLPVKEIVVLLRR